MYFTDATQYPPERLAKLGQQATAENSPFSLSDRIGLVYDALALAKAGYAPVSSALELISTLRNEKERAWTSILPLDRRTHRCASAADLVWSAVATNLSLIVSTWYEHSHVVEKLNALRRVRLGNPL